MAEPFIGEIRLFSFPFAPHGWAFCNGQLLVIRQNIALFSVLGAIYGGDGQTTFALPNMVERVPMHVGNGKGLTPRDLADTDGSTSVVLNTSQMPAHTHTILGGNTPADITNPANAYLAYAQKILPYAAPSNLVHASDASVAVAGTDMPHNNLQPFLVLHFCIALEGIPPLLK
jgi:microcystin-dependent protein